MTVKKKRKINKTNVWAAIISGIAILAFMAVIAGCSLIFLMLRNKPTLNLQDFEQTESSIIYDSKGEEIANLGTVIRQNVEYSEIPNCVVDAFVSIEDSRFFEHNGFDLPRFTKAIFENLRTLSFGQGGSTFTMQLVKNTYFTNDDTGEQASRSGVSGVRRKVQEIALAFELEEYEPKQFIFESYLNKLNYGGDRNIRGIQKAAQYYFSKDVSQLNVNEAALLAGVINAPNYYNPFYNIEAAQEREEEVLYQMYNHGYLSKAEYELAKTVKVKDLIKDPYSGKEDGDGIPYQAYIDAVVSEAIELTGIDPYTTTMHIYTYMNRDIQETMDDIQGQGKDDYIGFPDEYMECASVCVDNATGQVVGILGGRNYSKGGELLLNHATEQYKQPGSSIKPILDYCLAFENLGWATDHVLSDVPMYMDSSKQNLVYNFSNSYVGDVTLKQAVGDSINTCAIQTLQQVLDKMKYEYVVNYTQSLGYDFTLDDFNVQYAIGGSTCEVTPFQHAAAYAAILNNGVYNTPHTIKRIEFTNGKSPVSPVYESKQVVSEQAAYLTTELMKSNVKSYGGSYSYVKNDDYTVYGKTGTTDWGTAGKEFGIPSGANKDAWLVAGTSEYTTATWVGYEKAVAGQQSYITDDCYYNIRPQARIAHTILDACFEYGDSKPTEISKPSGISSITHIIGTWPYASTKIDGVDVPDELITTGLIKSDSVRLVSLSAPKIKGSAKGAKAELVDEESKEALLSLNWPEYPDKDALKEVKDVKDTSLRTSSGDVIVPSTGRVLFDYSWVYGPVRYKADITVETNLGTKEYKVKSEDNKSTQAIGDIRDGAKIKIKMYYQYENTNVVSDSEEIKLENKVVTKNIPYIANNADITTFKKWCKDNVKVLEACDIEVTDNEKLDGKLVVTNNGNEIEKLPIDVNAKSEIRATYYVYIDLSASRKKNVITFTAESGKTLNSYTPSWTYATSSDYSYDEDGENLIITLPDSSTKVKNLNVTIKYTSDKDSYSTSIKYDD